MITKNTEVPCPGNFTLCICKLTSLIAAYRIEFTGHDTEPDFTVETYIPNTSIEAVPVGDWSITLVGSDAEANDIA